MKRWILMLMLAISPAVYAQPTPTDAAAIAEVAKPAAKAVTETTESTVTTPDIVKMEGDKITVNDIVTDAKGVADAFKAYKNAQSESDKLAARLGLMALLAALFKILLSCVKFTSEFWKGNKGKVALRITTLALGIGVALTAHMAAGEPWMSAVMLGLSGPLAISFHELFDIIVGLVQKKPAPAPVK